MRFAATIGANLSTARMEQGLRALRKGSTATSVIRDEEALYAQLLDLLFETVPADAADQIDVFAITFST